MASEQNTSKDLLIFNGAFFHNFLLVLRKAFWAPLILSIGLGVFFYFYSAKTYTPTYQSRAVFAVSSTDINPYSSYATYYNSSATEKLITTFPYVLKSDIMKQLMSTEMGPSYSLSGIHVSSVSNSALFVIACNSTSPQRAYDTLCAVVKVYPQAAANVLGTITLNVVEEPYLPTVPAKDFDPWTPAFEAAGITLGICLLIIGLLAYLRKTVHSSDDLRLLVNVPCLCNMPRVQMKRRSSEEARTIAITNKHLPQHYTDAVRALRFHLKKELDSHPAKVIMVTSTLPNEGKSTVSANLALALAEQQKKVILIDADLRKQSMKKLFNIKEHSEGLTDILTGSGSAIKPIYVEGSSLLLLAGSKTTDRPQTLLSSKKMEKIIASLREEMDYIVIDTPPAGILSDAATMANLVDAAVYVVRQDYANRSTILDSVQMLTNMDIRFLGTVLNFTARGTTIHGYGYGNGYGYGSTYGYGNKYGYGYSNYGGYYGNKYGYSSSESSSKKGSKHRTHKDPYVK